jgi:hypothetical protein
MINLKVVGNIYVSEETKNKLIEKAKPINLY